MKRAILIIAGGLVGLLLLVVIAGAVFLRTPFAQTALISRVEPVLGDATNGTANIGAISGALPGHIVISDIEFSDADGVWAEINRVEMRWRPLAALRGNIVVDDIRISDPTLHRPPPSDPTEDETGERLTFSLPDSLPDLRISRISIENFVNTAGGIEARFDGEGALLLSDRFIDSNFSLASATGAENVAIDLVVDRRDAIMKINANISAAEDGLISNFADLGGPVRVKIATNSPADNSEITLEAALGAYGNVSAIVLADLTSGLSFNVDGRLESGPRLPDIPELADPILFNLYLQDEKRGARVTINRLVSALGSVAGDISWTDEANILSDLQLDLRADFTEDYRTDITDITGKQATLTASLQALETNYGVTLNVRGTDMGFTLKNGQTNLRSVILGEINASLDETPGFETRSAQISGQLSLDLEREFSLSALDLTIDEVANANGNVAFRFEDEALRFNGKIIAKPALITGFVPSIAPLGDITADINAAGPLDNFRTVASIDSPQLIIADQKTPGFNAQINLVGIPTAPTGDISAKSKTGPGSLALKLVTRDDGAYVVERLDYAGENFRITGDGTFQSATKTGEIDFSYRGDHDAQPWPGFNLAGTLNANGTFSAEGAATDLTLIADRLRFNDFSADTLSLSAKGPAEAIETTLRASNIENDGALIIKSLDAAGTAFTSNGTRLEIATIDATLRDNDARLIEPATIVLDNGATIENLRMQWGRNGTIAADASFSSRRWQGLFEFVDVNIPGTDGRLTATMKLDTEDDTPASGAFTVVSLVSDDLASLDSDVLWNGNAVIISNDDANDTLAMRLALPAKLSRTPELSVSTQGELDGFIQYDGPIEPFAAFMPGDLQTLEGTMAIDFTIDGTTSAPAIDGTASISGGAYTELRSGLSVDRLTASAKTTYTGGASHLIFKGAASGAGQSDEDSIKINGTVLIDETTSLSMAINLNNAELSAPPINTVRADGEINIAGPFDAITANGNIIVQELDAEIVTPETTGLVPIEVVNVNERSRFDDERTREKTETTFNVAISADDRIFVRGRGLESEWRADVRAVSNNSAPVLLGTVRLRKGTLDFSGRRFELTRGEIAFDRLSANNPQLDIRAEFETDNDVTAAIVVSGRASEPVIELTSVPALPEEDVVALILFGKPADELTAFESLQTAQALASLGGIGPFGGSGGLTSSLRQATGLDLLNLDIDPETGGGSLTVGKYVADGLFVSATQDAQGKGGAVIVEYDLTDNISVETELRQDGDQTVSANWKKDF